MFPIFLIFLWSFFALWGVVFIKAVLPFCLKSFLYSCPEFHRTVVLLGLFFKLHRKIIFHFSRLFSCPLRKSFSFPLLKEQSQKWKMFLRLKFFWFSQKYFLPPKTDIKKAGISAGKNGSNIHIAKSDSTKKSFVLPLIILICKP